MDFSLQSEFHPAGDQPEAIKQLSEGILGNEKYLTLLGVTGSGKTFTVANVVEKINRPTLVLAHNKTLAAQLYSEFKQFFPNNAIEYLFLTTITTNQSLYPRNGNLHRKRSFYQR